MSAFSLTELIVARLSADASLAAVAAGGIWKRPLKREGPGATPEAFYPSPPYQPRPAIVVRGDEETTDLAGGRHAVAFRPTLWLYAAANDSGRGALATLKEMSRALLVGWRFTGPNGTGGRIERLAGGIGPLDAPDVEGAVLMTLRLVGSGLYANGE